MGFAILIAYLFEPIQDVALLYKIAEQLFRGHTHAHHQNSYLEPGYTKAIQM